MTTIEAWETTRAPELRALFAHYVYGLAPEPAEVTAREVSTATSREGGTWAADVHRSRASLAEDHMHAPMHPMATVEDRVAPPEHG